MAVELLSPATERVVFGILVAALLSQGIKFLRLYITNRKNIHLWDLFVTGGFPSTHTALISSLATAVFIDEGSSNLFIHTIVLSIIIITDALGVRRTSGEEGKAINKIIKLQNLKLTKVHYATGHTPVEVLGGLAIGILSSLVASAIF
ncbi:divergent PAP2 family protein [Candidatus Woesearchaeota archaeon]|nr:divergent PAP2 family protein [Candidatus Woesearchaeota archaeon]